MLYVQKKYLHQRERCRRNMNITCITVAALLRVSDRRFSSCCLIPSLRKMCRLPRAQLVLAPNLLLSCCAFCKINFVSSTACSSARRNCLKGASSLYLALKALNRILCGYPAREIAMSVRSPVLDRALAGRITFHRPSLFARQSGETSRIDSCPALDLIAPD